MHVVASTHVTVGDSVGCIGNSSGQEAAVGESAVGKGATGGGAAGEIFLPAGGRRVSSFLSLVKVYVAGQRAA